MRQEKGRPATERPSESRAAAKPPSLAAQCSDRADSPAPATLAALSAALRDRGVALANENADAWWRSCADTAIGYLASVGRPFSADDVQALIPPADHPCRMGGRFHAAVRAGIVHPVGYTLSVRPARHRGVQRLYVGGESAP